VLGIDGLDGLDPGRVAGDETAPSVAAVEPERAAS
jgi:hypothetical protein